jgi:hypothetical protein
MKRCRRHRARAAIVAMVGRALWIKQPRSTAAILCNTRRRDAKTGSISMSDGTTAQTEPPAPPKFISGKPRFRVVTLEEPLEYDGREYREIHLVKLTAKEVADWLETLAADGSAKFPIFRDAEGARIPDAVLDGLDADDREEVDKAAMDFLPRRFRGVMTSASGPADGEATGPTSNG